MASIERASISSVVALVSECLRVVFAESRWASSGSSKLRGLQLLAGVSAIMEMQMPDGSGRFGLVSCDSHGCLFPVLSSGSLRAFKTWNAAQLLVGNIDELALSWLNAAAWLWWNMKLHKLGKNGASKVYNTVGSCVSTLWKLWKYRTELQLKQHAPSHDD